MINKLHGLGAKILLHPNIPKPLHGLTPRELMGVNWWDIRRRAAYAHDNYHCWACGCHKTNALFHRWLEGHECYLFNYRELTATFMGVSALCHACHNFIHDGRMLALVEKGELQRKKYQIIVDHGNRALRRARHRHQKHIGKTNLPWPIDNPFMEHHTSWLTAVKRDPDAEFGRWRLIIGDKTFGARFRTRRQWQEAYGETP